MKRFGTRLGSILLHHDHAARGQTEFSVAQRSDRKKLIFCDNCSEDETPMQLSVLQQLHVDPRFVDKVTANAGTLVPFHARSLPRCAAFRAMSKTVAKLVQSDQGYSMMTADKALEDFDSFRGKQLGLVQLTESTRAQNALEGERRRTGLTNYSSEFEFMSRNVCYDGATSLRKKERLWMAEHPGFNLFYVVCGLHSIANDVNDSFTRRPDVKAEIDGINHLPLAVNKGAKFLKFASMCQHILLHRTQVREGAPPRDGRLFKTQLLKLCVASGTRLVEKLACLRTLPNGDWRPIGEFIVWVPPGSHYSADRIRAITAHGTTHAACGNRFSRYVMKRWVGADRAFDEQLLMEGINGLKTLTFIGFDAEQAGLPLEKCPEKVDWFVQAVKNPSLYPALVDHPVAGVAAGNVVAPPNSDPQETASLNVDDTKAVMASVMRNLNTRPFGKQVVIRQAFELTARATRSILWWSSLKFERLEKIKERASVASGGHRKLNRTFAVLEAASGKIMDQLHSQANVLLECTDMWVHILPLADQTLEMRSLAFELVSSVECNVEHSVGQEHKRCPISVFRVLCSEADARALDEKKACSFSPWGVAFRKWVGKYGGFQGRLCYMALLHLAPDIKIATSFLESLHATLRRLLMTQGVQASPTDLETLAWEWLCIRARNRSDNVIYRGDASPSSASSSHGASNVAEAPSDDGSRAKNPWNLYMRRCALGWTGIQPHGAHFNATYHAMDVASKRALESAVAEAAPGESWGPTAKEAKRAAKRQRVTALSNKLTTDTDRHQLVQARECNSKLSDASRLTQKAIENPLNNSLERIVQAAKYEGRLNVMELLRVERHEIKELKAWQANDGLKVVRAIATSMSLQLYDRDMLAFPSSVEHFNIDEHAPSKDSFRPRLRS